MASNNSADSLTDLRSLLPEHSFSRRSFLSTTTGAGFASAALSVSAQTRHTDTQGLDAGPVSIALPGGSTLSAYRARPAGARKAPVVLVLSEIFGVHEHIADVVRRLAKVGYFAVAPELFTRQGDVRQFTETSKLISEVISKVPDAQVLGDLDATLSWAGQEGGDLTRAGVIGFCWGGRMSWLVAARSSIKAAVAWYGRLEGARSDLTPQQPVDVAATLKAPVLGLYGGQDQGIPLDSVDRMKSALAQGGQASKASEIVVYPEAPHAFHADYRPSYRPESAEDSWRRALAWLRRHGVV